MPVIPQTVAHLRSCHYLPGRTRSLLSFGSPSRWDMTRACAGPDWHGSCILRIVAAFMRPGPARPATAGLPATVLLTRSVDSPLDLAAKPIYRLAEGVAGMASACPGEWPILKPNASGTDALERAEARRHRGIEAAKAHRAEPTRNTAIATRNSGLRPWEFNMVGAQEGFEVAVAGQRTSVYSLRSDCTMSV